MMRKILNPMPLDLKKKIWPTAAPVQPRKDPSKKTLKESVVALLSSSKLTTLAMIGFGGGGERERWRKGIVSVCDDVPMTSCSSSSNNVDKEEDVELVEAFLGRPASTNGIASSSSTAIAKKFYMLPEVIRAKMPSLCLVVLLSSRPIRIFYFFFF
jgi:hypothetical protein